jgi:hypothetical protein
MPRSRGRKPPKKKTKQLHPHLESQPTLLQRFLRWLLATRLHQIEFAVSLLVGVVAIAGWIYDAVREPEIHPHSGNVENPFELRFSLHNPSFVFWMKNMQFTCIGEKIVLAGNNIFTNGTFDENLNIAVRPQQTVEYSCPFDRFIGHKNLPTTQAQISIGVSFRTLWFERRAISDHFSWTDQSHEWIEGEIIN